MLTYNTMRFGTDVFSANTDGGGGGTIGSRQALLIATEPLDATDASAVNNFVISGSQPSGTDRRVLFQIDNKIHRFTNGTLTEYTGSISITNVLANGNTVDELSALTNITSFVGKEIFPIIAIKSENSSSPTIKIGLNITNTTEKKAKTFTSGKYNMPQSSNTVYKIVSVNPDLSTVGDGKVTFSARYRDSQTKSWSAYSAADNLAGISTATQLQFRAACSVVNVGSDLTAINGVSVAYVAEHEMVTGDVAELFSVIPNFETNLRLCYLVVRHKKLIDSTIEAFANFFPTPKHRERILVGVGTGSDKPVTYTLGVDDVPDRQIDHSSIRVYVDGVQTSDFDYNTETSEINLIAADGVSILASYDYDCGSEDWHPMIVEFFQQPYFDGSYMTRFSYTLPDEFDASLANIRLRFNRPSGKVENFSLGSATGKKQQIVLPHVAVTDTIQLNADFTYDFDTRVLTFVAPEGTELVISYDWLGEKHKIYSWAAGWSAA